MCFIPLFYRWFISHLPQSVMKNELGLRWNQKIMSLSLTLISIGALALKKTSLLLIAAENFPICHSLALEEASPTTPL